MLPNRVILVTALVLSLALALAARSIGKEKNKGRFNSARELENFHQPSKPYRRCICGLLAANCCRRSKVGYNKSINSSFAGTKFEFSCLFAVHLMFYEIQYNIFYRRRFPFFIPLVAVNIINAKIT